MSNGQQLGEEIVIWTRLFFRFLRFLFFVLPGHLLPSGMTYRRRFGNVKKLQGIVHAVSQANAIFFDEFQEALVPNLVVLDVTEISRSQAAETVRQLGLDLWCPNPETRRRLDFLGETDLLKVKARSIDDHPDSKPFVFTFFLDYYQGYDAEMCDFEEHDVISIVLDKKSWPVFAYNHHTHVLANCDYWDLHIKNQCGVIMPDKAADLVARAQGLIMATRAKNEPDYNLKMGDKPSRAHLYGLSYDEPPKTRPSTFREYHEFITPYGIAGLVGVLCFWIFQYYFG